MKCGSSMRAAYFSREVQMPQFQISPNQFHRKYLNTLGATIVDILTGGRQLDNNAYG
jgi:hypothetical protein